MCSVSAAVKVTLFWALSWARAGHFGKVLQQQQPCQRPAGCLLLAVVLPTSWNFVCTTDLASDGNQHKPASKHIHPPAPRTTAACRQKKPITRWRWAGKQRRHEKAPAGRKSAAQRFEHLFCYNGRSAPWRQCHGGGGLALVHHVPPQSRTDAVLIVGRRRRARRAAHEHVGP